MLENLKKWKDRRSEDRKRANAIELARLTAKNWIYGMVAASINDSIQEMEQEIVALAGLPMEEVFEGVKPITVKIAHRVGARLSDAKDEDD